MSQAATTAKEVEELVASGLGARRSANGVLWMPLVDGYTGFVGLNRATSSSHPGWINVFPQVGVRHEAASKLMRELTSNPDPYRGPTWSAALADLSDGLPSSWAFEHPVDRAGVDRMVATLRTIALPAMFSTTTLAAIRDQLAARRGAGIEYALPIVMYLEGDHAAALAYADGLLADTNASPAWREFYSAFRGRLAELVKGVAL